MSVREVGRVVAILRYPVKSMAAEALAFVEVGWQGLEGDRRWALVRPDMERSGFPWLTIRELPELWHYRPRLADPSRPDASPVVVHTPGGAELDVLDPALAAELGPGVRVMKQNRGTFDAAPLSLISTQTIAGLAARAGVPLSAERFRPNFVVDAAGGDEFPEDAWVGAELQVGGMRMRVDKRDQRCVMINVDPRTTAREPAVLRTVARERAACAGVYGTTVAPGPVAVGDLVRIAS